MYLPTGFFWDSAISILNCWKRLGYFPRFHAPRTFNEFFLREKITFNGDIELARTLTDKLGFKDWLLQHGYANLVIPNLLIAESVKDLENYEIRTPCIIKPTHSSGNVLLIREPTLKTLSSNELATLNGWLKEDYYLRGRESNYFGLKPRLIVEELLLDDDGNPPYDFKILCANGSPIMIQVDIDRFTEHTRQLYSTDWELLPFTTCYPRNPVPLPKPEQLDYALEFSSKLSSNFFLCRVDLYFIGNYDIKAGEITFYPANCAEIFDPLSGDFEIGKIISNLLPK